MTNNQIISMIDNLGYFSEKKLPQKISYAITRNLLLLQKDYECYITSLNKLCDEYKDYHEKDDNGQPLYDERGIPIINDTNKSKELLDEIMSLLNIEIELKLYHIQEDVFNYEDNSGRYDALSAKDIITLQSILCVSNDEITDADKDKIKE